MSVWSFVLILGRFSKNSSASTTVISKISDMFFPLYLISRVSLLYRLPLHTSQGTYMSGRKCISIFKSPSPEHASLRPPRTLKLNLPELYPRAFASCVEAKSSRMSVNTPVYVAGLDLGVRPIGDWSIFMTLSKFSIPNISS